MQHGFDLVELGRGPAQSLLLLLAHRAKGLGGAQFEQAGVAVVLHALQVGAHQLAGQSVKQGLQLAQQHRAQCRQSRRATLEVRSFVVQPGAHQFEPGSALAAQALQLDQLLGGLAPAV